MSEIEMEPQDDEIVPVPDRHQTLVYVFQMLEELAGLCDKYLAKGSRVSSRIREAASEAERTIEPR